MLNHMKNESNMTLTENGALAYKSTGSCCLDLFGTIGALRGASDEEIVTRFVRAFAEDRDLAMKILFFGRDARGGLGERRVFRVILEYLARFCPESLRKSIALIPEYGRFDDLLVLFDTPCEGDAVRVISEQLAKDLAAGVGEVSLLAKWLPSVNASNRDTCALGMRIARALGMSDREYRKALTELRGRIRIVENNLRERDYSFDYSALPSKAMLKYRKAFLRNDGERYGSFLKSVAEGRATMHTGAVTPYEIVSPLLSGRYISEDEKGALDVTWRSLPDFCGDENALAVVDGSGSMYCRWYKDIPAPIDVAISLGLYFAERNRGTFANHFITFSETPRLVEVKGESLADRVAYCSSFDEVANTNLAAVFELILSAAIKGEVPQEEMPSRLYIVSDMEFDSCVEDASVTNLEYAKKLFEAKGYRLPDVVFWNVCSRNEHQPVRMNEQGVALVSGCTPRLFADIASSAPTPLSIMLEVLSSPRYASITA